MCYKYISTYSYIHVRSKDIPRDHPATAMLNQKLRLPIQGPQNNLLMLTQASVADLLASDRIQLQVEAEKMLEKR